MPPENTRKSEVLRVSQMGEQARNGLTRANSSSFVALRRGRAVAILLH